MELTIDNRESTKSYFTEKNYEWVKYQNLLVGDYVFKYKDELVTIIERKTVEDFAASINDGRYREQKHRLLKNYPINKILYIIEGDLTKDNKSVKYNKVSKSTIYSSIINMYLRDNLNVFHCKNKAETLEFLETFASKIKKQGIKFLENKGDYQTSIVSSVNISKKDNLTPKLVYKAQLCSIPGISQKYADPIMDKYSNLPILIQELSKLSVEERVEIIKNIKYTKKEKTRKLGKRVANNLVNYIFV